MRGIQKGENVNNPIMYRRPWGFYTNLEEQPDYKVKKLWIAPHQSISLQSHDYRTEDWTIVRGIGKLTLDDITTLVTTGGIVHINQKQKHRVENIDQHPLVIIEVQRGTKLEETDIKRYDDKYGRI